MKEKLGIEEDILIETGKYIAQGRYKEMIGQETERELLL